MPAPQLMCDGQDDLREPLQVDPSLSKNGVGKCVMPRNPALGQYPFPCCDVPIRIWISQEKLIKWKNDSKGHHPKEQYRRVDRKGQVMRTFPFEFLLCYFHMRNRQWGITF